MSRQKDLEVSENDIQTEKNRHTNPAGTRSAGHVGLGLGAPGRRPPARRPWI